MGKPPEAIDSYDRPADWSRQGAGLRAVILQGFAAGAAVSFAAPDSFPGLETDALWFAVLGLVLSQAYLAAAWAVFGRQSAARRYLGATAAIAGLGWIYYHLPRRLFSGEWGPISSYHRLETASLGVILWVGFLTAIFVLSLLKFVLGMRLERDDQPAAPRQFQLVEFLFWMASAALIAVAPGVGQSLVPEPFAEWAQRTWPEFPIVVAIDGALLLLWLGVGLQSHVAARAAAHLLAGTCLLGSLFFLLVLPETQEIHDETSYGIYWAVYDYQTALGFGANIAVFSLSTYTTVTAFQRRGFRCKLAIFRR